MKFETLDLRSVVSDTTCGPYTEWLDLLSRTASASIRQHPELVRYALDRSSLAARSRGYLLRYSGDAEESVVLALLPHVVSTRYFGARGLFRRLGGFRVAGNGPLGSCNERLLAAAVEAIEQVLLDTRSAFLFLEDVEVESVWWRSLTQPRRSLMAFLPSSPQMHHRILLQPTEEQYFATFSGPTRKRLRAAERRIGRVRLERFTSVEQVPAFIELSMEVSSHSWQHHRIGERMRNDEYERATLEFLARSGKFRSYVLFREDVPVAFEFAHQHGGVVMAEEAGYDLRVRNHSPGTVLQVLQLRDLFSWNRPTIYDFGPGEADYKRLFANHAVPTAPLWLVPRGPHGYAATAWIQGCRHLRSGSRTLLTRLGFWSRLRRAYRSPRLDARE